MTPEWPRPAETWLFAETVMVARVIFKSVVVLYDVKA
jgi:hypothetical protein